MLGGVLYECQQYEQACAIVEPVVHALLAMIPEDRKIHVDYGVLQNRPFHRLMHGYVLLLDQLGRHAEANRAATRMLQLHASDNIGFRFLKTRRLREDGK